MLPKIAPMLRKKEGFASLLLLIGVGILVLSGSFWYFAGRESAPSFDQIHIAQRPNAPAQPHAPAISSPLSPTTFASGTSTFTTVSVNDSSSTPRWPAPPSGWKTLTFHEYGFQIS